MEELHYNFIDLVESQGWVHLHEIDEEEFPTQVIKTLTKWGYLIRKGNALQSTTV